MIKQLKNFKIAVVLLSAFYSVRSPAQSLDYRAIVHKLDSQQYHRMVDTLLRQIGSPASGEWIAKYFVRRSFMLKKPQERGGTIEFGETTSRETFWMRPKIKDRYSDVPTYVDSAETRVTTSETPRSISRALRKMSSSERYFVQESSLNGEQIKSTKDITIVTITNSQGFLIGIVKFGPTAIDYDQFLSRRDRPVRKTLTWVLNFYDR